MVYGRGFGGGTAADERLVELSRGADLMVFEAQYTPAEYEGNGVASKKGWGHSTYAVGAALARRAGVKRLALYHHAPERADKGIERPAAAPRQRHPPAVAAPAGHQSTHPARGWRRAEEP